MTEESTNPRLYRIGELLIEVNALTSGDLTEAIQISRRMGVPIGRVLVMSGCVTENNLQQALELQSLLKDGLVDVELGFKALHMVFADNVDLQTALKNFNWQPKQDVSGNKLGDLLIDSNIVSKGQLDRALEASFQSGMPLGGTLVLHGFMSAQLLPAVLHAQEMIRENKISRDAAIEELKMALMFWAKADQSKQEELQSAAAQSSPTPAPETKRESTAMFGSEKPIFEGGRPVGETSTTGETAAVATASPDSGGQVSLVELMKLAGYCNQKQLDYAIYQALNDSRLAAKMLLAIGFIDSSWLNNFIYCQALISKGKMRTDQALHALNAVRHRQVALEQVLEEIGVQTL